MVLGELDSYMQKMKLDRQLTPYTNINSRWIKDLNISCDTIKVLEENISKKISDIPCNNILNDMSPRAILFLFFSNFITLYSKNILYMISVILNTFRFILYPSICGISWRTFHALLRRICVLWYRINCFINFCYVMQVYIIVQVLCFIIDFLLSCFIYYWKLIMEV